MAAKRKTVKRRKPTVTRKRRASGTTARKATGARYVARASQTTGRAPTKRLKRRRQRVKPGSGMFPNPAKITARYVVKVQIRGLWQVAGMFPNKADALEYATALNKQRNVSTSVYAL